jgi:hypothetical protein
MIELWFQQQAVLLKYGHELPDKAVGFLSKFGYY